MADVHVTARFQQADVFIVQPVASGQSKQKTTSTPTASSSPAQQDTQGGLSEQKRSALKAAITPDNQQNSTNGSDLLKPLSTRRLDTPASKIAQGTTSSAPTSSGTTATSSQGGAKPDFRTLRAKRDERQQNSSLRAVNGSNEASKREDTTFKIESEKTATSLSIPAVPSPKTIYEFERRWDDRKETLDRAALLQVGKNMARTGVCKHFPKLNLSRPCSLCGETV